MKKFIKYDIKPNIETLNECNGQFEIGPLETGFGITIGNALRRTVLSNVPGASVFAIKIPNITHEFQAIEGVKEEITQIILNLKQLVLKINDEIFDANLTIESWPTMKLGFNSAKVIKASDIELPIGFEIVNKDLYIATKTSDKKPFEMEIYAKNGRGFKSFKQNQEYISTLSIIATDSNFSPIIQMGYNVEERKISKNEVGDYLHIDLATNGSVSPTEAIAYASKILTEHFEILVKTSDKIKEIKMMNEQNEAAKVHPLSTSIEELDLSVRSYNCLKANGIQTIHELTTKTKTEVEKFKNLGKKSLREIQKKLTDCGLTFRE